MPSFEIKISGLGELQARLAAAAARLDENTKTATVAASALVETAIKDQLRKTSHTKRTRTPAAPGMPPSLISGNLMRSIAVRGPTGGMGVYGAEIGPTAIYGRIQDLGGTTGRGHRTHLPARPYVRPGWEHVQPAVAELYLAAWTSALG